MAEFFGTAGDDVLTGTEGDDRILGGDGDDNLTPGEGNDTVNGGRGDDTLNIHYATMGSDQVNLSDGADQVVISGPAGRVRLTFVSDRVGDGNAYVTSTGGGLSLAMQAIGLDGEPTGSEARYDDEGISFRADAGIALDMRDAGTGHLFGDHFAVAVFGDIGDDTLVADASGAHFIDGGAGDDELIGGDGNDVLLGGAGNDVLQGGAGDDWMRAGLGDDIIIGGAGNDNLNGGRGADHHEGGDGDDTYVINHIDDVVVEELNAGIDTVRSSISYILDANVENLTLLTSGGDINATGNELNNVIFGNASSNVIYGAGGRDILTGFGGADRFLFVEATDSTFEAYDVIRDLSADDTIDLRLIDANTEEEGDQAFTIVDAFSGDGAEIVLVYSAERNHTWLTADTDADGVADFRILLMRGDHTEFSGILT